MDKPVYSTAKNIVKDPKTKKDRYQVSQGVCKMRLETKGRGGKAVTVLFNLPFSETEAHETMKALQTMMGCGATLKGSQIEFQGDRRNQIESYFSTKGWKITRAGG